MYRITTKENTNPLLNEVIILNEKLNFKGIIYPNLGASIQKISINDIELIDGITPNEFGLTTYKNKYNSSILFPFPNRIENGTFEFENNTYQLELNELALNNRLHGHVFNKYFTVKDIFTSENNAKIIFRYKNTETEKGFPFPYTLDLTYTFTNNKISLDFDVHNSGTKSFPFGIGWHPYFKAKNLIESVLDFEADKQYLVNKNMIPTGETSLKFKTPLQVKDTFLDDCFITKNSKSSFKTSDYKIIIHFSSESPNSFLQVYTPETRDCIAIEPMTCAPNSFNNENGLLILKAGEKYKWKVDLNYSL